MSDPSRPMFDVKGSGAAERAPTPAAAGSPPPGPDRASTAPGQEARGPLSATSDILSENELDWRENQSRPPAQSARLNALLIALFALASVAGIALLVLLYRYLF